MSIENKPGEGTQPTAEQQELIERIKQLEADKSNLVSELQDDRKKRQDIQDQVETLKEALENSIKKTTENPEEEKLARLVAEALNKKESEAAAKNKKTAFDKFLADNKEFHPENDPSGLKRIALEKKLALFNVNGLSEVDDFYSVMANAKALLGGQDTPPKTEDVKEIKNPYASTSRTTSNPTVTDSDTELDSREKKLLEQVGWTKDKYLKMKAKQPAFVASILEHVR